MFSTKRLLGRESRGLIRIANWALSLWGNSRFFFISITEIQLTYNTCNIVLVLGVQHIREQINSCFLRCRVQWSLMRPTGSIYWVFSIVEGKIHKILFICAPICNKIMIFEEIQSHHLYVRLNKYCGACTLNFQALAHCLLCLEN